MGADVLEIIKMEIDLPVKVKSFFTKDVWSNMSDTERTRVANVYANY